MLAPSPSLRGRAPPRPRKLSGFPTHQALPAFRSHSVAIPCNLAQGLPFCAEEASASRRSVALAERHSFPRGRPTVVSRPRATLRHTNSNPLETRGAGPTREPGPGKSMATRVLPAPQNSRRPARSRVGTPPIVRAVCMCPPARLLHAVERRFRRTGCFEPKLGAVFLNGGLLEGSRNHGHVGLSTGPQLRFVAYIPSVETPLLPKGLKPRAARPSGDGAGEEEDGEERGGEEGHTRQT